ncbi:MAG TPA: glyoxalase/bleomycin resistance/extradiol dioxygenase family protein [Pyrinomonadaceae bacterium]|nr:glyoxalase/bleomycin resistance/extradiol dioxygenase family protein [Pyrinomonadaceae bacterium]
MKLNPYLNYNGQCAEAFKFYEQALGGKITFMMTWGESPMAQEFPNEGNRIMHATLAIGESLLMGADVPADSYQTPQGISVSLHIKDTEEGARIFNALAEGGAVQMPFEKTFWAAGFGVCTDRFGIPWLVNCEEAN